MQMHPVLVVETGCDNMQYVLAAAGSIQILSGSLTLGCEGILRCRVEGEG